MVSHEPELAPRAQGELNELGVPVGFMLHAWLQGLAEGAVPAYKIRELLGAPHDPPWQWTPYVDGIVVVFRFLSRAEMIERSLQGAKLLIARIVSEGMLSEVAKELLRDAP